MGAGASMPAEKMAIFLEKLRNVDTLSEIQKERLLEQMAHEVKKIVAQPDEMVGVHSTCCRSWMR
jgi:hypothetical protein